MQLILSAMRRLIQLGLRSGSEVEVMSGLDGTETVVLVGDASVQPGQIVEVIQPKE